ncbi:MAG: preprotein translocase subunit SecG [Clostridia bacterium]|nr:preprotein translocase subunit SecG [Clostridia bacterium]
MVDVLKTVVTIIQIVVSVVLIASVLMQSAKKEGMSGIVGGASETFFGKNKGRTLDGVFAVITTVSAIIFLISSLFLYYGITAIENRIEGNNAPQTETQIPLTMDEDGNYINPETGEIVISAEDVANSQQAEGETENTETPAE